jgi:hypothetical protein
MGAGLVLAGVACLVAFSQDRKVELKINQPTEALGFRFTYLGMTSQPYDRDNGLRVRVEKNGRKLGSDAAPVHRAVRRQGHAVRQPAGDLPEPLQRVVAGRFASVEQPVPVGGSVPGALPGTGLHRRPQPQQRLGNAGAGHADLRRLHVQVLGARLQRRGTRRDEEGWLR